jgi:hypothetical protein
MEPERFEFANIRSTEKAMTTFVYERMREKNPPEWIKNFYHHNVRPSDSKSEEITRSFMVWANGIKHKLPRDADKITIKPEMEAYRSKVNNQSHPDRSDQIFHLKAEISELRKVVQEQQKLVKQHVGIQYVAHDRAQPKEILINPDRKKQKCKFGNNCSRGNCPYDHGVPKPEKGPIRMETVNQNNVQHPIGEVEDSIFATVGITDDGRRVELNNSTAMYGKIWNHAHGLKQNNIKFIEFTGKSWSSSQPIPVKDLYFVQLKGMEGLGDDLIAYQPPQPNKIVNLERNKSQLVTGQQLWMAALNMQTMKPKVSSGYLDAKSGNFATYDFSTVPGDCGSPVMIGGTRKVVGLHLYGSASGNSCLVITDKISVLMNTTTAKVGDNLN